MPRAPRNPRNQARSSDIARSCTPGRLGNISRFLTRVIGHGQPPDDGPVLSMAAEREIYMNDVVSRPIAIATECTEADLHVLANDVSDGRKKRLKIAHDGSTDPYMVACYNGHSKPVAPGDDRMLIRRPTYFVHGETRTSPTSILHQGLKDAVVRIST